jgi:hypothetical protein
VLPSKLVSANLTDFSLDLFIARKALEYEVKQAEKQRRQAKQRRGR